MKEVKSIWHNMMQILTRQQKILGVVVFICALLAAAFETIGVSVIIPLVNALLDTPKLWQNRYVAVLTGFMHISSDNTLILLIIVLTIIVYIIKNLYFIFYAWIRNKYSFKVQREISVAMMTSYMNRGYSYFLDHNFNELRQGVENDVQSLYYVLTDSIQIFSQIMTILMISVFLCIVDWHLFIAVAVSAVICLVLIVTVFRKRMHLSGQMLRKYFIKCSQTILETFYGIKEVFVMRKQRFFVDKYNRYIISRNKASIIGTIGSEIPAYIIEMICITGIMIALGISIRDMDNRNSLVAVLAAFAMAAIRMLPSLGKISSSINQINSCIPGFNSVCENIIEAQKDNLLYFATDAKDDEQYKDLCFNNSICLNDISFRYSDNTALILDSLNLEIPKGESVAFVGESGAGKSTLADVILGILKPQNGNVCVDGVDINKIPNKWSNLIGFVPQSIFLSDSSIRENVAFGVLEEDIDDALVKEALEKADLMDFVNTLEAGMYTEVGDRGIRMSGGQRQRIGLARAMYHRPQILILDEATSALDNETERAVMESIEMLHGKVTLIIIAHRLSTIKNCDIIYEIKDGKAHQRKYDEL